MAADTAVGINDNLASGQPCIAVRPANHKLAGGVDKVFRVVLQQPGIAQYLLADLHEILADLLQRNIVGLMGNHHRVDAHRLAVDMPDGNLRFRIRAKVRNRAGLADLLQLVKQAVAEGDRRGHQLRSGVAGIAEHHALVASALLVEKAFAFRHALRNIGRLPVQAVDVFKGIGAKLQLFAIIADIAHHSAGDGFGIDIIPAATGNLTGIDHQVGGGQRFASHPARGILRKAGIENGVGNLVANLVGMPLRHRLGSENMVNSYFTHGKFLYSFAYADLVI